MEPEDPVDKEEIDRRFAELELDPYATLAEIDAFADEVTHLMEFLPPRKRAKPLPPDLHALFQEIRKVWLARQAYGPDDPLVNFEGFEVHDVRRGGMGLILQARDTTLDRWVAIKLWQSGTPEAQEALVEEARILAKFNHPNVVSVYGTGQWRHRVYFVMEWVDGLDGHEWMQTPNPWDEVREVFISAGDGLAAAHAANIQHRDFKPANMLLSRDGRVLVADFGVADRLDSINPDQDESRIVGTPSYMAPERLRGGRGDARSDQFSFCVSLWRALYGLRPYGGDTRVEVLEGIERGELRVNPDAGVPDWLSAVARKGLSVNPDDRYASMPELIEALIGEPTGGSGTLDDSWVVGGGRGDAGDGRRVWHMPGWAGFVGGALVAGLGVLALVRSPVPQEEPRGPEVEPEPVAAVEGACVRPEHALAPSDVAVEVCDLIRRGYMDGAVAVWKQEQDAMMVSGASKKLRANDDLIIAATYVAHAKSTMASDRHAARRAALEARSLTLRAAALNPDGEGLILPIRKEAERLAAKISSSD